MDKSKSTSSSPLPTTPEEYRAWWTAERPDISYGCCWCGCGNKTNVNKGQTDTKKHVFRNEPVRYIRGHVRRKSPVDYRVDPDTGCWIWLRTRINAKGGSYGQMWADGRRQPAYRVYYEREYGAISKDKDVHHVCVEYGYGSTLCVNPEHLEALSRKEHLLRHSKKRTNDVAREPKPA